MTAVVARCAALFAFVVFPVACADRPTTPSALLPQPPISQPPPGQPAAERPPLTGPNTTYVFSGPLSYPVRDFTTVSRYVLYHNGAFTFEYAPYTTPYLGVYRQESGRISLDFGPNGRSDASGDLTGDFLEVRYTEQMQQSDFEDAVYRRSQ